MIKSISVNFYVNKQKIKGTLFFPPELKDKNPAVLFIHGWKSTEKNYVKRAEAVAKEGAVCLTFDLRGHGESEGDINLLSRADYLVDTLAAYDFLSQQKEVDSDRIGVCGISFGGYLACLLTKKRKLNWLVLRVPALYPDRDFSVSTLKLIDEDPSIISQTSVTVENNSALKYISEFKGDTLLGASENDKVILPQTISLYISILEKNNRLIYQIMKGADHQLSTLEMEMNFVKILSDWFRKKFNTI